MDSLQILQSKYKDKDRILYKLKRKKWNSKANERNPNILTCPPMTLDQSQW
jgi:hypothetical protein